MNLSKLRASGDWPFSIDLHPRINVLMVPDADRRERLREIFAGIVRGELTNLSGTIAFEGTEFDLEQDAIEILGIPPTISITLTALDLPGASAVEFAESAEPAAPPEPAHDAAGEDDDALAAAHTQVDEARRRLDEARGRAQGSASGDGGDEIANAQAELDRARAHLNELDAEQETPEAEAEAPSGEVDEEVARLEEALRQAEDERREDEIKLAALPEPLSAAAVSEVEARRQRLREAEEAGPAPSDDAIALADHWVELQGQAARATDREQPDPGELADHPAKRALDEAKVELTRAEHGARPLYVTPDMADELDRAHANVAEAEDRAFRRLAGPLAKRRLESAKQAEEEILKKIGVTSYDAYLMQSSPGMVDADAHDKVAEAKQRLAEAEAAWKAVLAAGAESDADGNALQTDDIDSQLDSVRAAAAALLGHRPTDATLEAELRDHRVSPDLEQMRIGLRAAVTTAGGQLEADADDEAVGSWLKAISEAEAERAELRRVLTVLDRRVDEVVRQLDEARQRASANAASAAAGTDGEPSREAAPDLEAERVARQTVVTRAEEALAAAQNRAAETQARRLEVEQLESALEQAEAHLAEVEHRIEAAGVAESPAATPAPSPASTSRVDVSGVGAKDAELYVLARIAAQRAVGDAGPLPLIIDDAFAGFPPRAAAPVFDLLSRMSGIVQVIYLTADDAVRAWAERLGPEEATIFRFASAPPAA